AAVDRPAGLRIAVDGGRGIVLAGGEGVGGGFYSERLRNAIEGGPYSARGDFAEPEISKRPFVIDAAGTVLRQSVVGHGFQAERGDSRQSSGVERDFVNVALGHVAAGENRTVFQDFERRDLALRSDG